jgi:hypothetical protein
MKSSLVWIRAPPLARSCGVTGARSARSMRCCPGQRSPPVRTSGDYFVVFRDTAGTVGMLTVGVLDEFCMHRRVSLALAEWRRRDLLPPPRLEVRDGRHHSRHARSLRRALSGAHQGTGLSRGRRGGRPSLDLHWPEGQAAAAPSLRLHGARPGSEPCSPTADTKALGRAGPILPTSASSTAISPTRAGRTKAFRHPMSGKPLPPPMAWTA